MYGLQLRLLEEYVEKELGKEKLDAMKKKIGAGVQNFIQHKTYSEDFFVKLLGQAAQDLGKPHEECLEEMGHGLWRYLEKTHQNKMLYVCGKSLKDFLHNLDHAHSHLRFSYPEGEFPHFRVEEPSLEDRRLAEANQKPFPTLIIHYESKRGHNLSSYAKGILDSVSEKLYQIPMKVVIADRTNKGATFHIFSDDSSLTQAEVEAHESEQSVKEINTVMERFSLSASDVMHHWPWFFAVDTNLRILCMGRTISRIMFHINLGDPLFDHFDVENPLLEKLSFDDIEEHANTVFVLRSREPVHSSSEHLLLRGAFEAVGAGKGGSPRSTSGAGFDGAGLLYLCSPKVQDFETMRKLGITMSDIPLHDATRDLTLLAEHFTTEQRLLKNLEVMSENLKAEKQRNDEILFSLLPPSVVKDLNKNMLVQGTHVDGVTVLFSDIVGFTNLSSAVTPQRMFAMLDELYTAFDTISGFFDVFKLGTVGDAYMIAGGVPRNDQSSASKAALAVIGMAFAMNTAAEYVTNPASGEHIRIRIGLHSGSVMAGIVGTKVPTYCIFGDTVNTASRMESNGEEGKIHCSEDTAKILEHVGYKLEKRDTVLDVKGKGRMQTYWVVGRPAEAQAHHEQACAAAREALENMRAKRGSGQSRADLKERAGRQRQRDWKTGGLKKLPALPAKPLTPPGETGPAGPVLSEEGEGEGVTRKASSGHARGRRASLSKSKSFGSIADDPKGSCGGPGDIGSSGMIVEDSEEFGVHDSHSHSHSRRGGSMKGGLHPRTGSGSYRRGSIGDECDAAMQAVQAEKALVAMRVELDRLKIRNRQLEAENEMFRHESALAAAKEGGTGEAGSKLPSRTCMIM